MAIEKRDIDSLIEYIRQDPTLRQRVLLALLPDEFLALPASVARLAEAVDSLVRAVQELTQQVINLEQIVARHDEHLSRIEALLAQHDERLARLEALLAQHEERLSRIEALLAQHDERLARLEALLAQHEERLSRIEALLAQHDERLARLEEVSRQNTEMLRQHAERIEMLQQEIREMREHFEARMRAIEERMDRFEDRVEKRFRRLENRVGSLLGWQLEERYRTHAYSFFGQLLKDVQLVDYNSIDAKLRQSLSDNEIQYLARADLLLRGYWRQRPDEEVYLTLEVSSVVDMGDVERSVRRSALLEKAGLRAVPAVGGHDITPDARQLAQERNVVVALDGNLSAEDAYPED